MTKTDDDVLNLAGRVMGKADSLSPALSLARDVDEHVDHVPETRRSRERESLQPQELQPRWMWAVEGEHSGVRTANLAPGRWHRSPFRHHDHELDRR